MPKTLEELAIMMAKRDNLTYEEEMRTIRDCICALEDPIQEGQLDEAEDILGQYLGLEPDYLDLFIF